MRFPLSGHGWLPFFLFPATVFLSGCAKENAFDCVKSTGKVVTEKRELPAFTELTIEDNLNVTIVPDSVAFAEVKCGENLQANLETSVSHGKLLIRNLNKCNWVRSYNKPFEVTLHLPGIKVITHDGFGTVRSAGPLKTEQLFLHLTGAGDFDLETETSLVWMDMYELGNATLRGQTKDLKIMNMSTGKLFAENLRSEQASLQIAGDGDATVNVSGTLGATISGRGNVYFVGEPALISREGQGPGIVSRKAN